MPDSQEPKQGNNNDLRNAQFGGGFINAENVNAGRIGGDILNFFFGQQTTPVGNPARPKNERILLAAVKEEVTARLRQSLHNAVLINLGKESQPQQVKRPWDAEIKIGLKSAVSLPDTTTILEVFDSPDIAGKLLILGAPGSGKTTTQLELAQALVSRAEEQPDYPVPILLNLSSWKDDRQSITDWLMEELKFKYGVSKKLGQEWVNNRQLLPMLDGLDELEPQRQELCLIAINQLLQGEYRPQYLIVCSRTEEYANYNTRLQLNGAIHLQPLTDNQIRNYLASIKRVDPMQTISRDPTLLTLVQTPLFLSVTTLACVEISLEEWQRLNSSEDRLQYLLDAYIRRMLGREIDTKAYTKQKPPTARQTRLWLVWLAQQLQQESQTEFLIEKMQPSWLISKSQKRSWRLILGLSYGLIGGLSYGLILMFIGVGAFVLIFGVKLLTVPIIFNVARNAMIETMLNGLLLGLIIGLSFGLSFGLSLGQSLEIKLVKKIIFPKFTRKSLIKVLTRWLIEALFVSLVGGWGWVLLLESIFWTMGLIIENPKSVIEIHKNPNQGIKESATNAVFVGLFCGLITVWLIHSLIFWRITGLVEEFIFFLPFGLMFGLLSGLRYGGNTCLQHFTLRLILYFNGYIPWNYARFLNYCTERMLLQRVGGRYRFIHKLLQDHFAQMEFKRD